MGLIFDGIDLKTNYNFVVTNINGRGSPPVSRTMLELPRIDGAIELNSKLQSRNITISGYVYGTDASTKKDALIKLITQAYSQEKKLTFPDTNRSIYVKLAGEPVVIGPVGPVLNAQAYELTFNFVAQDPYFYGEDHDESGLRIVKVNANAPIYLISPRRKFLKREAAFKIEPYTIVNLLGKYGDFENDSDGNGVADGWNIGAFDERRLDTSFDGSNAQYLRNVNDQGWKSILRTIYSNSDNFIGHTFFFSAYAKINILAGAPQKDSYRKIALVATKDGVWKDNAYIYFNTDGSWNRQYNTLKCDSTDSDTLQLVGLYLSHPSEELGVEVEVWLDKSIVIDLTTMGALPYGLQQYFSPSGITQWEDLATISNITALDGTVKTGKDWLAELLPFVNGVKTLGFAWEGI